MRMCLASEDKYKYKDNFKTNTSLWMADEHRQGKRKEEEEANTVLEQHVGEKINVNWK